MGNITVATAIFRLQSTLSTHEKRNLRLTCWAHCGSAGMRRKPGARRRWGQTQVTWNVIGQSESSLEQQRFKVRLDWKEQPSCIFGKHHFTDLKAAAKSLFSRKPLTLTQHGRTHPAATALQLPEQTGGRTSTLESTSRPEEHRELHKGLAEASDSTHSRW